MGNDIAGHKAAIERMCAAASDAAPDECCGLLLGAEAIEEARPAANVAPDPHTPLRDRPSGADRRAPRRAAGGRRVGYYHSHPAGPAEPSVTDRAMAAGDGKSGRSSGKASVTFWRDDEDGFAPLPYVVEDR